MQTLALFDFDGTLLSGDTIIDYVRFARKSGLIGRGGVLKILLYAALALNGTITEERGKQAALAFRMRMPREARETFDRAFLRDRLLPRLYAEGKASLLWHAERGDSVLVVSASTENYLRYLPEFLPVTAVLCTRVAEDGTVTRNCKGAEKPRRVEEWLQENGVSPDWAASYAYGDSESDLPMLAMCGHKVCVNAKKRLRKQTLGKPFEHVTW